MKKKWIVLLVAIAVMLMGTVASAAPSTGDLIHFLPTVITVTSGSVMVEGYFVNLNTNCSVRNFSDFDMSVYLDGQLLVDGYFGNINAFTVNALSVYPQSFTFNGNYGLNNGTYVCDDHFYCSFGARFSVA